MSSGEELRDFEIDELEESTSLNTTYGGEIEVWEPLSIELQNFEIQNSGSQEVSALENTDASKISIQPPMSLVEMQQMLTRWITKRFDLWTFIGVLIFITTGKTEILLVILSGTGLFAVLLLVIYNHYFRRPKK